MNIDLSVVGTPEQPVIPPGETAIIDMSHSPVPRPGAMNGETDDTNCGSIKIGSSAGMKRNDYFASVQALNPNMLPNMSTHPADVYRAMILTDAWEQEFVSNPASGHNDINVGE